MLMEPRLAVNSREPTKGPGDCSQGPFAGFDTSACGGLLNQRSDAAVRPATQPAE